MAQMQVLTYDALVKYDTKIKNYISTEDAKSIKTVSITGNKLKLYKIENPTESTVADIEITLPETDLTDINNAIAAINDGQTGILAQAKTYTDGKISDLENGAVKNNTEAIAVLNGEDTVEGSVAKTVKDLKTTLDEDIAIAKKAGDDAQRDVDALNIKVGDVSTLTTTAKTDVVSAINEVKEEVSNVQDVGVVTIDTSTTTEGYLKSYTIKQGENNIGVIDIPKDLVVTSGEIVVNPEGQVAGTYIKLTIANQEAPIYINVKSLVDVYTAKQSATQIQLTISDTNEISAIIVAGSVTATELATDSVTTIKIADANVTLAKLADDVKNSFDASGSATTAETNAKDYADGLNTAMDTRVTVIEEKIGDGFTPITSDDIDALFP